MFYGEKNKKYIVIFIVIIAAVFTGCSNMLTENPNRSPTSVLSGNDYTLYPGVTQELDLSESYDVDEQPIAYYWEVTTSPSTTGYTLTGETESVAEFSATTVGSYQIEASVTDEYDVVDKKVVNILVTHDAPVATGGAGATRYPGVSYTLSGSATDEPDGLDSLIYAWSVVSTPASDSEYTLTGATTLTPTFVTDFYADTETTYSTIPSYIGSYTLRLTVTDEWGLQDTSDVVVTVENDSPTANLVVPALSSGDSANLTGNLSYDPDSLGRQSAGDLRYVWSVTDSPVGSTWIWGGVAANTGASFETDTVDNVDWKQEAPGVYTLRLTVYDEYGASSSSTKVVAASVNTAPVFDTTAVTTDDEALLLGSGGSGDAYYDNDSSGVDDDNDTITVTTSIATNTQADTLEYDWNFEALSGTVALNISGVTYSVSTNETLFDAGDALWFAPVSSASSDGTNDLLVTVTVTDGVLTDTETIYFDLF